MSQSPPPTPQRPVWLAGAVCFVAGLAGAVLGNSGLLPLPSALTDRAIHGYIMAHPEVLPEAMDKLRASDTAKQVGALRPQAEKPWPGAIMGNPNGRVVLVEFMDFACGYCRQSLADVDKITSANPQIKVVLRQLPILSPDSVEAAKMALAAADQGKYGAFHKAMYAAERPDAAGIEAAAKAVGLDIARARAFAARPDVQAEVEQNLELARKLGISGTPSWIVGDQLLSGAVGYDELAKAVAAYKG